LQLGPLPQEPLLPQLSTALMPDRDTGTTVTAMVERACLVMVYHLLSFLSELIEAQGILVRQ